MKRIGYRIEDEQIKYLSSIINKLLCAITPINFMGCSFSCSQERFVFDRAMLWVDSDSSVIIVPNYLRVDVQIAPIVVPWIEIANINYMNVSNTFKIIDFDIIQSIEIYKINFNYESIEFDIEIAILINLQNDKKVFFEFSEEGGRPAITMHITSEKITNVLETKEKNYDFRYYGYELSRVVNKVSVTLD